MARKGPIEEDTARREPVSFKPPPPKPPITFSSDNPVGKGAGKGKGATGGGSDSKGSDGKGEDSEGKADSEGKEAQGDYRGGKTLPKVEEADRDATASRYSPKTAREENWGPVDRRKEYSYHQRQSENEWEYVIGSWKLKKNKKRTIRRQSTVELES